MSLLDSEDEPFVEKSSTQDNYSGENLYDEELLQSHRSKDKKDKKTRLDDRRSTKTLPWSKSSTDKDKTPKKGKHHRTKSGSPPLSPKSKSGESKKINKATASQLQPSPHNKNQRKRYVQLGGESGSSSEGEVNLEGDAGFLVSNQPALAEHSKESQPTTLTQAASTESNKSSEVSFFDLETSEAHSDAWWPQSSSNISPTTAEPFLLPQVNYPHVVSGGFTDFVSPQRSAATNYEQPVTVSIDTVTTTTTNAPEWSRAAPEQSLNKPPDWSISDDLLNKCKDQFYKLDPTDGHLQGDKAREFFIMSKLPNQELSLIWRLADTDKDNALSETEFCIAMKLVLMRRKGYTIPNSLPEPLLPSNFDSPRAQHTQPQESTIIPPANSDQVLVDIGQGGTDTDVLVPVDDEVTSPSHVEPAVGRIVSLDDTGWESEGDETVLVQTLQLGEDEELTQRQRELKPSRPAPPKPAIRKSKSMRSKPDLPPRPSDKKPQGNSPPVSDTQTLITIIDSRHKPKTLKKSPGASRRDYDLLGEDASVLEKSTADDKESESGYEKGHARSTSLDLNKMLLAESLSDVLDDIPSEEPPKPPPRPNVHGGDDGDTLVVPRTRARALSTGSINTHEDDYHISQADTSTDALLLSSNVKPKPPPKPKKKAPLNPPSRPPPPIAGKTSSVVDFAKDKADILSHIKTLKENNLALTEVNSHLENKLFKLIDERVLLSRKLKQLQVQERQLLLTEELQDVDQ